MTQKHKNLLTLLVIVIIFVIIFLTGRVAKRQHTQDVTSTAPSPITELSHGLGT